MIKRLALLAALAAPQQAAAHAFESGQDTFALILQGLSQPWLMLPVAILLIGLGMLAGILREEAAIAIWPAMILGTVLGLGLGPFVPQFEVVWLMAAALIVALLGIAALPLPGLLVPLIAFLATALPSRFLMEAHAFGELPIPFVIGMGLGITTCAALAAGLVQATRERIQHGALVIGWRALISWVGAMAILMMAFEMRPI